MNRALLPALIAGIFAANGAMAADRELLFGPAGLAETSQMDGAAKPVKPAKRKPVVEATRVEADSFTSAPVATSKRTVEAKAAPVKTEKAEAKVLTKPEAKPAPVVAVAKVVEKAVEKVEAKPEVKPAPVVAAVAAPAELPKMPTLPVLGAVQKVDLPKGADPMELRGRLISKLKQQISVGFFPSANSPNEAFSFLRNFMPLSNHLSQKTGVLVNFIPERGVREYAVRIRENRYPAIFINSSLSRHAIDAGYVPLVVGKEELAPAYIVRSDSKFKKVEDLKDAKIAWSRNAQISVLAMTDFGKDDLAGKNTFVEVGNSGRSGALNLVNLNLADVAVLRSTEAKSEAEKSGGKLRVLGIGPSANSSGLWVRKDLIDSEFSKRITAALLAVSPDSSDEVAKDASISFSRGFGVSGEFIRAPANLTSDLTVLTSAARKGFPSEFRILVVEDKEIEENLSHPAIEPVKSVQREDVMSERDHLVSKLKSQVTVGFFPSATNGNDTYSFLRDFMPLANHLSQKSGVLVNFIPERNLKEYGRRISEDRYPVVFINAILARDAFAAGYVPLAVAKEELAPGYVVKMDSPLKKIEDIKNVNVAWSRNAQTSLLAMSDVARLNLAGNKFSDVGTSGRLGVVSAITSGSSDVGIWRAVDMEKIVKDSNGKLRLLGVGTSAPASGLWVRKDIAGTELAKRMEAALLMVNPDSSDRSAKDASASFAKGFGIRGEFMTATPTVTTLLADVALLAQKAFPEEFQEIQVDEKERDSNMARPAIESIKSK